VEFVEPGNGGFESELATGDLQPLNEICGAGEQHAPAIFDKGEAESRRKVALAAAARSSVILPGVRRLRFGSSIRFTRAAVKPSR
jgi:hypothetical protein